MYLYRNDALPYLIFSPISNNTITWHNATNDDHYMYLNRYEALSNLIVIRNSNNTITRFYQNNDEHYMYLYTVMSHFRT